MRKKARIGALLTTAFAASALALTFIPNAQADVHSGGSGVAPDYEGDTINPPILRGPQVPLDEEFRVTVKGDYVAAGVGMRNIGGGTINIALPAGSTIVQSFLYWAIIRPPGAPASNLGTLNGFGVTGALVGTSGDPCWPSSAAANFVDVYVDDVTAIAVNGANILTGFPSLLTGNEPPPSASSAFPLLEGASLVVIFTNPLFDFNEVVIRDGAQTFFNGGVMTAFGNFTAPLAGGMPADQIAQTSYIVADGQARFASTRASFNGAFVAGPGTGLKTADAFDGADGIANVAVLDGLWDTLNVDVSSFFPPGVPTAANADVDGSLSSDCLTWAAQVISVKTALMAKTDVKPGSNPNCVNPDSGGVISVAYFGSGTFDPADVDRSTLEWGGASPLRCAFEDSDEDGITDLVCKYKKRDVNLPESPVDCVIVEGSLLLFDGTPFVASDHVCVTGEPACNASTPQ